MITKLDVKDYDFTKKLIGLTLERSSPSDAIHGLSTYIPILMSNIPKGKPAITQGKTDGMSVFKNAKDCCPIVNSTIKKQNYLLVKKEDNVSLTRIMQKVNGVYGIPKDTKLQIALTHGKISLATFNTDIEFQ